MAATKRDLHRFVKERGEPQTPEGSEPSLTRQQMAAAARVHAPQIKLERGRTQPTFESSNMPAVSVQRGHKGHSVAKDKSSNILGWQEDPQSRSSGPDMWDTDVENIDNTTTMSSGHSVKNEYSQTKSNTGMQLTSNDINRDQRTSHNFHMSVDHEEHIWNSGGLRQVSYQEQDVASFHQDYSDEEDVGSDESADGELSDDDPTLDRTDMNALAYLKPAEINDYESFKEEINEPNCIFMNISPLLRGKDAARSSSRLGREQSRNASFEPVAHPTSYGEGSNAQQNSMVAPIGERAILDHEQSDFTRGFGKQPELSAPKLCSSGQEAILSVRSYNSVHVHGLPRSPSTVPNNRSTLPQQPKKVRGIGLEPNEFGLEGTALKPSSMNDNEPAKTFNKLQSPVNRKRSVELDYAEEELSKMTYEQLKSEVFDHNPSMGYSAQPDSLTTGTLESQLAYISNLTEVTEEDRFLQQQDFFSSLPIEKYEECGDIILGRFTQILNNFKEARQMKRSAAKELEEEVAQREQRVSTRLGLLGKNMERLRRAGQDVIKGKAV